MGFLTVHWPSALLLDNFDAFAEKLMVDSDEQNGAVRVRKAYQSELKKGKNDGGGGRGEHTNRNKQASTV